LIQVQPPKTADTTFVPPHHPLPQIRGGGEGGGGGRGGEKDDDNDKEEEKQAFNITHTICVRVHECMHIQMCPLQLRLFEYLHTAQQV